MVILIYPMFSNSYNLNADSTYVFIRRFIEGINERRNNWWFLYMFPSNLGWKYKNDGFFEKNKNVIRVPFHISTNKKEMVNNFIVEEWKSLNKKYAYDVFLNNTPEITSHFTPLFQAVSKGGTPLIINQHHYVIHSDLPYLMTELGDKGILLNQLSGTLAAKMNVFNSKNCKKMIDENFYKNYGSVPDYPNVVNYYGFDSEKYRTHIKEKDETTTFVYNHRFQSYKNWRATFEVFDELYRNKNKFKVLITSIDKSSLVAKRPYVEYPNKKLDRDEYLDYIARGHINMLNSQHETFCQSMAESMLLEQVMIAPNKATFPELAPENYPYIFENKKQQYKYAEYLINNREEVTRVGKGLRDHIAKKFSRKKHAENWLNIIEGGVDNPEDIKNSLKKKSMTDEYFSKLPDKIPAQVLFKNMRTWIGQDQAFPNKKLKTIANAYGFEDLFIDRIQYFKRK